MTTSGKKIVNHGHEKNEVNNHQWMNLSLKKHLNESLMARMYYETQTKGKQMNKTIEQLKIDLENLNRKHDILVANLTYLNTEINLLEQELKIELDKESPFTSVYAMGRMLGII